MLNEVNDIRIPSLSGRNRTTAGIDPPENFPTVDFFGINFLAASTFAGIMIKKNSKQSSRTV